MDYNRKITGVNRCNDVSFNKNDMSTFSLKQQRKKGRNNNSFQEELEKAMVKKKEEIKHFHSR